MTIKKPVNHKGPKGQTDIGKKAPQTDSKRPPKPTSAKTAALKMGEMMHTRATKTHAMKEKKNKTAKYH